MSNFQLKAKNGWMTLETILTSSVRGALAESVHIRETIKPPSIHSADCAFCYARDHTAE